jgi:hypothetical protein
MVHIPKRRHGDNGAGLCFYGEGGSAGGEQSGAGMGGPGGNGGEGSGASGSDPFRNSGYSQADIDKMIQEAMASNGLVPGAMGFEKDIEKSWRPGVQQATNIYNEGLPALDPNNYLANTMASLNAGNPYASQLGGFTPNNPALNSLSGFDPSNPYTSQVGNFDPTNQGLQGLQNFDPTNQDLSGLRGFDPTNSGLQGLQNFDPTNSGLQGIQNFDPTNQGIAGFNSFTQGGTNPYAQQLFDISADQIQDQINSQFGSSGQGSSSGNLNEQISQLGDYGAQFFGGIYDNDMNRALQATQGRSDAYQAQNALGLDALGQYATGMQNQNQLGLNALGQYATGMQNQNQLGLSALDSAATGTQNQNALGLGALGQFSTGSQEQNALGLNALGTAQSGWGDSTNADLAARGLGVDAYANQDAQRLSALQAAGGMQQNATNSAASFLPGILSQIQNQPYNNLDQYSQIVSRLTGSSPQKAEQEKTSGFEKLIGLGTMAGGLSGFL